MKILAYDSSTSYLSISLMEGSSSICRYQKNCGTRHSELLVPTIHRLLKAARWTIDDIELIAIGSGPGSFTGLRIGFSAAKGFYAVLKNKVMTVPSMDAMLAHVDKTCFRAAPVLDARKGKVYSGTYFYSDKEKRFVNSSGYMLLSVEELLKKTDAKTYFFGDGVEKYKDLFSRHPMSEIMVDIDWYPDAGEIGRLALEKLKDSKINPVEMEPLYLYDKECNITSGEKI